MSLDHVKYSNILPYKGISILANMRFRTKFPAHYHYNFPPYSAQLMYLIVTFGLHVHALWGGGGGWCLGHPSV
jgi:hypothetical protein